MAPSTAEPPCCSTSLEDQRHLGMHECVWEGWGVVFLSNWGEKKRVTASLASSYIPKTCLDSVKTAHCLFVCALRF